MTSVVPQNAHKKKPGFSPCHISRRLWSLFRPFQCLATSFLPIPNASSFKCDCPDAVRLFSMPMRLVAAVRIRAGQDASREAISKGTFLIQSFRGPIDERHLWRYSQAQIADLVANAIPR